MEDIINERAKKHLFYICVAAAPLWLAWIYFDYAFAYDLFFHFLPFRIAGTLVSLLILIILKKNWLSVSLTQITMFAFYNLVIGYMVATVSNEALIPYFSGYTMIIIVLYFILILTFYDIIWFSLIVILSIFCIVWFSDASINLLLGNGGFVFLNVFALMIFFSTLRYKGVLRDASLTAEIEKARETEQLNIILENANREKETLLKEIHHRVKNNLQLVSSLLSIQSNYIKDEQLLSLINESKQRIKSMSSIHEILYKSKNFAAVDFSKYSTDLIEEVMKTYNHNPELTLTLEKDLQPIYLNIDQAIPCGLIINEIATNSVKYAFPNQKEGALLLRTKIISNQVVIEAGDNGIGLPEHKTIADFESLGLQLIQTLVEQLDGTLKINQTNGLVFQLTFLLVK